MIEVLTVFRASQDIPVFGADVTLGCTPARGVEPRQKCWTLGDTKNSEGEEITGQTDGSRFIRVIERFLKRAPALLPPYL